MKTFMTAPLVALPMRRESGAARDSSHELMHDQLPALRRPDGQQEKIGFVGQFEAEKGAAL
jgi:hypothetical protein